MTSSKPADTGANPEVPHAFPRKVENMIASLRGLPENPSRARNREVRELGSVIDKVLAKYQIGRSSPEERLREKWTDIVGAANASYSHPLQIDARGKLHILASHAVVRSEIQLHTDAILERVRALPGCENVKRLAIRQS